MLRSELLRRVAEGECLPVRGRTQTGEDCGASWQDVWALVDMGKVKGDSGKEVSV